MVSKIDNKKNIVSTLVDKQIDYQNTSMENIDVHVHPFQTRAIVSNDIIGKIFSYFR